MGNRNGLSREEHLLYYSPRILRKESALPLEKRIALFQKFESMLNGGSVFNGIFDSNEMSTDILLKKLIQTNLSAFTFKKSLL